MGYGTAKIDVHSLVASGGTVMMEGRENYRIGGRRFHLDVMGAFEINSDGRITRWRYSYDLKSVTDQVEAAGFKSSYLSSDGTVLPRLQRRFGTVPTLLGGSDS